MIEQNPHVSIDVTAPVVARVEAAARKFAGQYTIETSAYQRLLEIYCVLCELAEHSDGYVRFADVNNTELAVLTAEAPCFDFGRDDMALLSNLLTLVDHFDAVTSQDGAVLLSVGVAGLWRKA